MKHCPICRALLNGADTCRRCRAQLKQVIDAERRGRELAGAAMHRLALGDTLEAARLLRRACATQATPELRILLHHLASRPVEVDLRQGDASVTRDAPSSIGEA
jgi:predicted amidophosphoribosyltransferase